MLSFIDNTPVVTSQRLSFDSLLELRHPAVSIYCSQLLSLFLQLFQQILKLQKPAYSMFQSCPRRVVVHPLIHWILKLLCLHDMHLSHSFDLWVIDIQHARIWILRPLVLGAEQETGPESQLWFFKNASTVCPLETTSARSRVWSPTRGLKLQ